MIGEKVTIISKGHCYPDYTSWATSHGFTIREGKLPKNYSFGVIIAERKHDSFDVNLYGVEIDGCNYVVGIDACIIGHIDISKHKRKLLKKLTKKIDSLEPYNDLNILAEIKQLIYKLI